MIRPRGRQDEDACLACELSGSGTCQEHAPPPAEAWIATHLEEAYSDLILDEGPGRAWFQEQARVIASRFAEEARSAALEEAALHFDAMHREGVRWEAASFAAQCRALARSPR